jgi:hypothetical protein
MAANNNQSACEEDRPILETCGLIIATDLPYSS